MSPFNGEVGLRPYRDGMKPAVLPQRLREVMVAGAAIEAASGDRTVPPRPEPPQLPGFKLIGRDLDPSYTLYRYRAPRPATVRPETIVRVQFGDPSSALLVPPR